MECERCVIHLVTMVTRCYVPSLMIWGDLDFPHIKDRSRLAAQRIVNCSSLELKDAAHLPSLDKSGDLICAA
ncbi:MAG TPA: hypothetical protein DCS30_04730 [Rhizobiales bacterium]|nr:hypothetical protein [Hyphomicrobiales bacterium]